jgi:nucleoside-diphosphate-sugar epimerase
MGGHENKVGLLGATSLVGEFIRAELVGEGRHVIAYSRRQHVDGETGVEWRLLLDTAAVVEPIGDWVCAAPIWVLPQYLDMLDKAGARRVVAISSSSVLAKQSSSEISEQALVRELRKAESCLQDWAELHGITCTIFRPTLIYGRGLDRNVSDIARFIGRFRFFPLLGEATGRRQPVHAADIAWACRQALDVQHTGGTYALSGGEILRYGDMVERIFVAMGLRPRMLKIPLPLFRLAVATVRHLPHYRGLNMEMAERMNRDLIYEHEDAKRDFGYTPRPFAITPKDLP